jgi:hypothetical protein
MPIAIQASGSNIGLRIPAPILSGQEMLGSTLEQTRSAFL